MERNLGKDKTRTAPRASNEGDHLSDDIGFRRETIERMDRLERLIMASQITNRTSSPNLPVLPDGVSPMSFSGGQLKYRLSGNLPPSQPNISLDRVSRAAGLHLSQVTKLLSDLPPRRIALSLVHHYFKFENQLRYPIHEAAFRQALDMIYAHSGSAEGPSLACITNLPLVFIVLAQTVMGAGEELFGDERTRRSTSHKWYWSCEWTLAKLWP